MSHRKPWISERLYPPCEISALVRLLRDEGVSATAVLNRTGLDGATLDSPACRTSIEQALQVCRNAMRLAPDPALALRAGARSRLSDRGMVGLLLGACESGRDYAAHALRYQCLATPWFRLHAEETVDTAVWIAHEDASELPDDLRVFLVALHAMQQLTHLRDALGTDCRPIQARFAHRAPAHAQAYERLLGCPCVFEGERHEIRFAKDTLARHSRQANPIATALLRPGCDTELAELAGHQGYGGCVARTLTRLRDPGASMKTVASLLKLSDRTLRRRLAEEGTSFSAVAVEVQRRIATQQLKCAETRIEDVAANSGYSDAANFRRAFIRWTSMSPAQFRRAQQRAR